jgi:hypothetical protein
LRSNQSDNLSASRLPPQRSIDRKNIQGHFEMPKNFIGNSYARYAAHNYPAYFCIIMAPRIFAALKSDAQAVPVF